MTAILVLSSLLLGTGILRAPAALAANEPKAVIPPGREDLLGDMLGRGASLPGGCTLANGEVKYSIVRAVYACSGGEVVFELAHPSAAPPEAAKTDRFALTLRSGAAPDGLADALLSRIRARESDFEWAWVGESTDGSSPGGRGVAAVVVLLAVAVAGFVLRRRVAARRAASR